ncbi:peptide deformylase [Flavilitoribacter nigricans]|uniref:Peptide deformylase n=1 Tax=Flavilitoribacter nigricans (strain ATCC 23147 / DSM 23189 / NBRC 102662 / NCIMB 1420 / SS-2) TaxID=1122177 RepID=A0A2D0NFB3_FLAN2|nr:peptide deformylase [Flavilitoribacter nigricans]PHN07175.1 peptide deformylase [Flavilitoribacter nigricans DSM 23189 = NBRC 102662]
MILPIYGYGYPVLKKEAEPISKDYPELEQLIENMWETMYKASGVGLAAPQIGLPIRLFLVDTVQIMEEGQKEMGIKKVLINAQKIEEVGEPWAYEEGCLSIPDVRGDVERLPQLRIRYQDENFEEHEEVFTGINARVIQHEYDHIDGILFTEHLKPIKKRLIKRKLENIRKGKVKADYRMKFIGK